MSPGADKRGAPRAITDFVVEVYELDGRTLLGIARLLNLSIGGAFVETTSPLAEQASVVVRLLLGKQHLLTLPGEVVWVKSLPHVRHAGLRFADYPDSARSLISKFVQEYFNPGDSGDFLSPRPEYPQ